MLGFLTIYHVLPGWLDTTVCRQEGLSHLLICFLEHLALIKWFVLLALDSFLLVFIVLLFPHENLQPDSILSVNCSERSTETCYAPLSLLNIIFK